MTDPQPGVGPKRILLVTSSLRAGGTERQVALLANLLADTAGFSVTLALLDGRSALAYALSEKIQRVAPTGAGIAGLWSMGRRMKSLITEHDLTLSFLDLSNLLTGLFASGRPLIWNMRTAGVPAKWTSQGIFRLARARSGAIPLAIGNSQAVVDFYQGSGFACDAFSVIPNGIDPFRFQPSAAARTAARNELGIAADTLLIGCVARAHPDKRHDLLLTALTRQPDLHLLCIGDRLQSAAALRQGIHEQGLQGRVTLLDARRDIETLLPAIDIGVCVSDREGLPNSLLELMACGVACIGTRVGGIPELLQGVGELIRPNSADALVAALEALRSPELRARHAAKGRERVLGSYSETGVGEQWLAAIKAALPGD